MKTIEAYQVTDGRIFSSEKDAISAQDDIIGETLNSLLKMFEIDITRNQEYKATVCIMKKRKELKLVCQLVINSLETE